MKPTGSLTTEQVKQKALGSWASIAPELRPGIGKNPDGSCRPFYLSRYFTCLSGDSFHLTIINYADPYAGSPLASMLLKGRMDWRGEHPLVPGAQKVDFTADAAYEITPLTQPFVDVLNRTSADGFNTWELNKGQDILKKAFPLFGLKTGQVFKEYDLVYILDDLMFWGARHVDGRGFDTEANRPDNLQVPLIRSASVSIG